MLLAKIRGLAALRQFGFFNANNIDFLNGNFLRRRATSDCCCSGFWAIALLIGLRYDFC
jgi:hypothetical protein